MASPQSYPDVARSAGSPERAGVARSEVQSAAGFGGAPSIDARLQEVASRAVSFASASGVWIAVMESGGLTIRAAAGKAMEVGSHVPMDGGLAAMCAESGRIVRSDDLDSDRRIGASVYRALGAKSALMVPVKSAGQVVAVMGALSPTINGFTRTHVAVLLTLADVIAEALGHAPAVPLSSDPSGFARPTAPPHEMPVAPHPVRSENLPAPPPVRPSPAAPAVMPSRPAPASIAEHRAPLFSSATHERVPQATVSFATPIRSTYAPSSASRPAALHIREEAVATELTHLPEAVSLSEPLASAVSTYHPGAGGTVFHSAPVHADARGNRSWTLSVVAAVCGAVALLGIAGGIWAAVVMTRDIEMPKQARTAPAPPEILRATAAPPAVPDTVQITAPAAIHPASEREQESARMEATAITESRPSVAAPPPTEPVRQPSSAQLRKIDLQPVAAPTLAAAGAAAVSLPDIPKPKPGAPTPRWEMRPATLLQHTLPVYPLAARKWQVQGTVMINVRISEAGKVADARVISGPVELRSAALQAVKQWRYEPATLAGKAVESDAQVAIKFTLPN